LYVGQPLRPDRGAGRPPAGIGIGVIHDGSPVFAGISLLGPGVCTGGTFLPTTAAFASLSICFGVGMRQLAGRSVIGRLEHIKNKRVESRERRKPKK
jgi:hypothetical protein